MLNSILAISVGSIFGGLSRWVLSNKFNSYFAIPFGTLLSNLIAGYIIGIALMFFSNSQTLSPEYRLLIMTGFCGGLSTFSTFSVEIVSFFQKGEIVLGLSSIFIHLIGSLFMTYLGILTYQFLKNLYS